MEKIGDIVNLVPLANDIVKLNGFCVDCADGTKGSFTKVIKGVDKTSEILVGSHDIYKCVCRRHFS